MIAAAEVAPADFDRPVKEEALQFTAFTEFVLNTRVDTFVNAGNGDHHVGPNRLEVIGQQ